MIETIGLTKRYGDKTAVQDLSFAIEPGLVTGFLGPNGSGKSTTMRMILGLDRPSAGRVAVNGRPLGEDPAPLTTIGALLDAKAVPPSCSGRNFLRGLAATHGISKARVDQMIDLTGLSAVVHKPYKTYSLGMSQRLGIAAALLGDPGIVMMDEPVNGLDPEGVAWVRALARQLAAEGRTVFLSSHLMSEMAHTADHLIIIGQGRLLADAPISQFLAQSSEVATWVRSPQADQIAATLANSQVRASVVTPGEVTLHGLEPLAVGKAIAHHGWVIEGLAPVTVSLESAYLKLTDQAVEYRSATLPH